MKNASLNYKSSSVSNGWPMLSQRGVVTQIDNKIKESKCGISRSPTQDSSGTNFNWYQIGIYKWCHSNNQVMSIKNARFKPQPSTPNAYLCINEKHTFYRNWWQRGEVVQRYESFGRDWDKVEVGHGHGG